MILEKKQLQDFNRYMLGLGAPIERDNVGYSKPDYNLMEALGRYQKELSDEMAYAVAERLSHYKNTQLDYIANDLVETEEYYSNLLKTDKPKKYNNMYENYECKDFEPYRIHCVEETEDKLALTFDAQVYLADLNVPYKNSVRWESLEYKKLWVTKDRVMDFMERLKEYGKYGFEPDEDLKERTKDYINNYSYKRINDFYVERTTDDGFYLRFGRYANLYEFMQSEKQFDQNCMKWTKINDRSVLYVKKGELPYLYQELKKMDFYNDQVEEYCKDKPVLGRMQRLADSRAIAGKKQALAAIIEKKRNISGNHLVDYKEYDLPFEPYPFQIEDAQKIVESRRMLLGHDMGAGKTFIATLVGTSIDMPKLAVVPESLRLNWRKEIKNVTPDAEIRILYSKDKFDLEKDHLPDWTIVGYSTVSKYAQELEAVGYKCIFIDEAHNCKAVNNSGQPTSKRAGAVLSLCEQAEYVYPMTGTPIPTRNKDLYNIFKMLDVDKIGNVKMNERWSFFNYGKEYCDGYQNDYGWDFTGNSNSESLHKALAPYMVRRLKCDVLPELKKQRIFIPMESTSREYKEVEKEIRNMADDDTFMGLAMTGRRVLSKEKVNSAMDLAKSILEEDKSVVIVSNFNETLDTIQKKFKDDCCCIRGGMSDAQKQQAIDDFQSGKKHVCALNIVAGGVGVTLTKAHDMVICDYDWTPANMAQVEDRICRAGQTQGCNIHYIYCENSILDTTFVHMISGKSANIDRVVDNAENTMDMAENVSYMKALKTKVEAEKAGKDNEKTGKGDAITKKDDVIEETEEEEEYER